MTLVHQLGVANISLLCLFSKVQQVNVSLISKNPSQWERVHEHE